ncbi:MAG: SAM-dependent methyltransferase [Verrucomicrobiae bacterium]|nr:SAM-dependent methyltransferase [Verrucomicrobiae bacterium]
MSLNIQSSIDTSLSERIFHAISDSGCGSISFADYMRHCLYDPYYGYYASTARGQIGRDGDFYTSVSVGAGFGFFLGLAAERRWQEGFAGANPFWVIEQGAHDGQLALDFLAGLQERESPMLDAIRYTIFEPVLARAEALTVRLAAEPMGGSISVVSELSATPASVGLFLCNELLDAFPVHRLCWEKGEWRELRVAADAVEGVSKFRWKTESLIAGSEIADAAAQISSQNLPEGYQTEVCLELGSWMSDATRWFDRGFWWVIDYGREADDYHAPERHEGTLRGYRQHQRQDDPFVAPGETDLTADVNFTDLDRVATQLGLSRTEYTDQHHFLIRAAEPWLKAIENGGADALAVSRKRLRQFQTLTHPSLMGRAFKVAEYRRG